MKLKLELIESQIKLLVEEFNSALGLNANITIDTCPYEIGISSVNLVCIMAKLEDTLKITIPDNSYIFYEKTNYKQLSIKEASLKLLKIAK